MPTLPMNDAARWCLLFKAKHGIARFWAPQQASPPGRPSLRQGSVQRSCRSAQARTCCFANVRFFMFAPTLALPLTFWRLVVFRRAAARRIAAALHLAAPSETSAPLPLHDCWPRVTKRRRRNTRPLKGQPRHIEVHISPETFGKNQVVKTEAWADLHLHNQKITAWVRLRNHESLHKPQHMTPR